MRKCQSYLIYNTYILTYRFIIRTKDIVAYGLDSAEVIGAQFEETDRRRTCTFGLGPCCPLAVVFSDPYLVSHNSQHP